MTEPDLAERARLARERADQSAAAAVAASDQARAAAVDAAALEDELAREAWVEAQRTLGVADEHIDANRGIVTSLPIGPTYG